ncbi:MAG: L,D-transpeptidase family protein [Chlorobiaceae bacterium]|nr:L,D-transpeptidase family protein [Chlorobiaceae bacterium]NTV59691.1 L,D-transpeptidase family protein [Chlorobiaceae bacterium]
MTGILLLWLALSPVQTTSGSHAPVVQQQHQHHDSASAATGNAALVRNLPETIRSVIRSSGDKWKFNRHLYQFYAGRHYQTVWTRSGMVTELIAALEAAYDEGLDPQDYHIKEIRELIAGFPLTLDRQALYDVLLTDAYLTLASHLHYGKVDPGRMEPTWNPGDDLSYSALEYRLQNAIATNRVAAVLQEMRPQQQLYGDLKKGLAKYRSIAKSGGWPAVPEGPSLKPGDRDPRVLFLRKRLQVSGELSSSVQDTSKAYSGDIVEAVRQFQRHNGMEPDGVLGSGTLRAINVPVDRRIDQLRINLERSRWFLNDLGSTYIMVNIPDFSLNYVENGTRLWNTRVIVGKPSRETPVFKADMQYIIFNPQWVIPPTILEKDALPSLRRSAGYLAQKKLRVIDTEGHVVDPASVNWNEYSASNFPYKLQQTAGDHGSLGRIKFMLPNRYIVYLHDTPSKDLFQKSVRTFSSGCIRVEKPLDLARLVLRDSVKWSATRIKSAIGTGRTSTVVLPKRIPVYILYLTAVPSGEELYFRDDVYNRDDTLIKAMSRRAPEIKSGAASL